MTAGGQPVLVIPEVHETSFTIDIPDLKSLISEDLSGKTVIVQYSGTVTEEAVMGREGNCNSANIRYSNNPHGTQTGQSGNEFVPFFTYQLEVDKVDENDQPLSGASFILERKNEDGSYSPVSDEIVSSDGTVFTFERISAGDYRLTEVTAPAGYNLMDPVLFTVTAEYTLTRASMPQIDLKLTDSEGNVTEGNPDDGKMVLKAVNIKGVILPSTGGPGTAMLYGSGVVLLLASLLILQRKHEKE